MKFMVFFLPVNTYLNKPSVFATAWNELRFLAAGRSGKNSQTTYIPNRGATDSIIILYYIILCYILCYVMLCYVHVMLCYVMLCYVMLCYVMLC
jgi:hypothetical protein